jgi:nucleoid DNA-binding protein
MNKWDFVKKIAEKTGQSQDNVNKTLNALVEVLVPEVRDNGESVSIPGLGTFKQKNTQAREGRNPMNGEKVQIKASRNIIFKPQSSVKVVEDDKTTKKSKK